MMPRVSLVASLTTAVVLGCGAKDATDDATISTGSLSEASMTSVSTSDVNQAAQTPAEGESPDLDWRPPPFPVGEWSRLLPSSGPYGDHSRSCRSSVRLRPVEQLLRWTSIDSLGVSDTAPVLGVVADVAGRSSAVLVGSGFALLSSEERGAAVQREGRDLESSVGPWEDWPTFFPDGPLMKGIHPERDAASTWKGRVWAAARTPDLLVHVVNTDTPDPFDCGAQARFERVGPPHVRVEVQLRERGRGYRLAGTADLAGIGGGAISREGQVALFTHEGRFMVVDFSNGAEGRVTGDVLLPARLRDVAVTSAGYAALAHQTAQTELYVLDSTGRLLWTAVAPFLASQPPIDGGDGRVYLAGGGLAAFEQGRTLWASASRRPVGVMAYSDGGLAIATGSELRVMTREGRIVSRLAAPEGEAFQGRPGIAIDGTVWVATEKAVYVAR